MSIRKISFAPGEYYHLYNRGNSKQKIFHDKQDHLHFIGLLYACNSENNLKISNLNKKESLFSFERGKKIVSIGAYCLMPNHFHILISQKTDGDNISKFMQKLSTAYVMYYNQKYNRVGGLFEGKFKSQYLDTDKYLKYIFSYIHLNPLKLIDKDWKEKGTKSVEKSMDFLDEYIYSSFADYSKEIPRIHQKVLDTRNFPSYFSSKKEFLREILDWIDYSSEARPR